MLRRIGWRGVLIGGGLLLFAGGCAVFVLLSQTIGGFLLMAGLALAIAVGFADDGDVLDRLEAWARTRRLRLYLASGLLIVVGWALFLLVHQDTGLLLISLGGIVLMALIVTVQHDIAGGGTDGPYYGDTASGGFIDSGGGSG